MSDKGTVGMQERYPAIEDYALIGDCRSAALISRSGSLDWLCWPRFDSPAVFGALLDADRGGRFSIRPAGPFESQRCYRPNSNVLCTRFVTSTGTVEVVDLFYASNEAFPQPLPYAMILRQVNGVQGEVELSIDVEPRADYGRLSLDLRSRGPRSAVFATKEGLLHLAADFGFEHRKHSAHTVLTVRQGERKTLAFSMNENGPAVFPPLDHAADLIEATDRYWQRWSAQIDYRGENRDAVVRSALALKLMEYAPSGAIIAAPTTSLPEREGAGYNWDYRYCWLRDASFTVNALFGIGLEAEATAFLQWLLHATHLTLPRLQVMYSVVGKASLKERELDYLEGYRGSRPVRIGNEAHGQVQLDIYGEVLNAAVICRKSGVKLSRDEEIFLTKLARYVLEHWHEPDAGIWETRLGDQHHIHSKALCWLALDRAAALAQEGLLDLDVGQLRSAAEEIRRVVEDQGFNSKIGAYTSTLGGDALDAAVLRLPLLGFADARDPRMLSTVDAVRAGLSARDLIFRHENTETGGEGAFLLCSFWLVECLVLQGQVEEAESIFEALCRRANDVGLYAEEVDPISGSFLGNFPQAYTHVGLINAALRLEAAKQQRERVA